MNSMAQQTVCERERERDFHQKKAYATAHTIGQQVIIRKELDGIQDEKGALVQDVSPLTRHHVLSLKANLVEANF